MKANHNSAFLLLIPIGCGTSEKRRERESERGYEFWEYSNTYMKTACTPRSCVQVSGFRTTLYFRLIVFRLGGSWRWGGGVQREGKQRGFENAKVDET